MSWDSEFFPVHLWQTPVCCEKDRTGIFWNMWIWVPKRRNLIVFCHFPEELLNNAGSTQKKVLSMQINMFSMLSLWVCLQLKEKHVEGDWKTPTSLGGGFKYLFSIFTPIWGRFPICRAYFSDGLVEPATIYNIYSSTLCKGCLTKPLSRKLLPFDLDVMNLLSAEQRR